MELKRTGNSFLAREPLQQQDVFARRRVDPEDAVLLCISYGHLPSYSKAPRKLDGLFSEPVLSYMRTSRRARWTLEWRSPSRLAPFRPEFDARSRAAVCWSECCRRCGRRSPLRCSAEPLLQ